MKLQQVLAMQAVTEQAQRVLEIAPVEIGDGQAVAAAGGLGAGPAGASLAAEWPLHQTQVADLLSQARCGGNNIPGLYEAGFRSRSPQRRVAEVFIQVDSTGDRAPERLVTRLRVQQQVLEPAGAESVDEDVDLVPEAGVSQIGGLQSAHVESLPRKPIS